MKKLRISESELVNLIRRTIKETEVLNEIPGQSCNGSISCDSGESCNWGGANLHSCGDSSCGRCGKTTGPTSGGGGKRGTKSSSGSKGDDRSRIGDREVGEGQDYHGSHAGGYGTASSNAQAMGEHTLPPPNQNHQHSSCVASDCFMDMSFSNGTQYGGTLTLEGCGVGTYTAYVNNQMSSSGSFPTGSISTSVMWGGATTPKITIKAVLQCTHPSSSPTSVTKTICVQRSTGNVISCNKNIKTNKVPLSKSEIREIRRQDSDRARRRPYSAKARDMRGGRVNYQ